MTDEAGNQGEAQRDTAAVAQWRGRVEKTLEVLEKSQDATTKLVQTLQTQVTRLVVITGIIFFLANVLTSVAVGIMISKFK